MVESGLDVFVEFFRTVSPAYCVLVCVEGGGELGCDKFGDRRGDNSAKDCATCDGAYFAVGFDKGDDSGAGNGVEGVRWYVVGGEEGEGVGEGVERTGVFVDDGIVFVALACRAGPPVFWVVFEGVHDVEVDGFDVFWVGCCSGWW